MTTPLTTSRKIFIEDVLKEVANNYARRYKLETDDKAREVLDEKFYILLYGASGLGKVRSKGIAILYEGLKSE